jgi:hypothetical protein
MTASSDVELIKRLAHALHGFKCATSSGPPDLIPRPSALLAEAYARLAQPEPEVAGPITDGRPMNQSYWLALLRHDAYAASFQSVAQYRSALIERASSPRAQPEPEGVIAPSNRPIISAPKLSIFAVNRPAIKPVPVPAPMSADTLAAIIREVDGTHRRLGAAALAEAILAHPAAINAQLAPVPVTERFEFSVFNSEYEEQAGGNAPTYAEALSYGQHYLSQYSQDGPHSLEIRRVEVLPHSALPVPGAEVG